VDGTGSRSSPMASFDISGSEHSGSTVVVLVLEIMFHKI
jgi:hypothetical protein